MGKGDRFMDDKFSFGPLNVSDEKWASIWGNDVIVRGKVTYEIAIFDKDGKPKRKLKKKKQP